MSGRDAETEPTQAGERIEARAWLLEQPHSGEPLLERLDRLQPGTGEAQAWRGGLLWLRYPDWFGAAGWEPEQAAAALNADALIEPDPRTPMRRVRDQDGQRWLVLNAAVSDNLRVLLGSDGEPNTSSVSEEDASAVTDRSSCCNDPGPRNLPAAVIAELIACHGSGGDGRVQALGHAELKAIAKRHGLGVYSLRERLLSDPRFRKGADQRLEVTL